MLEIVASIARYAPVTLDSLKRSKKAGFLKVVQLSPALTGRAGTETGTAKPANLLLHLTGQSFGKTNGIVQRRAAWEALCLCVGATTVAILVSELSDL